MVEQAKKYKVQVVEDEQFLLELLMMKLTSSGFEATGSVDAEEALKAMKETKPDIILLDLLLPGMSGFEFMEEKGKDPETVGIPVIIFSNLSDEESLQRGTKLGAKEYLIKAHTTPAQVVERIKTVLHPTG